MQKCLRIIYMLVMVVVVQTGINCYFIFKDKFLNHNETTNNSIKSSETKPYTNGVPPAPPFREIELTIIDTTDEGCGKAPNKIIGYIIEVKYNTEVMDHTKVKVNGVSDYDLIVQDEQGVRGKYYIESNRMSNAERSWLPYLLIPGNKVKMEVQYCGSGGFSYVMSMKSLKRD